MAYQLPYKYTSWEDQVANGWQSRTAWKAEGVIIPADAKPRGLALRKSPKKLEYDLFAEGVSVRKKPKPIPADDLAAMELAFPPADQGNLF